MNKLEWQKDDPLPCGPVSRHAAATVGGSAEGRIYIHAFRDGVVRRDACGIAKSHKTTGQGPESLSMCAVAPVGDAGLLVVGGATKNGEFSDRAYVLDTKSYEWTELDAPNGPTARVMLWVALSRPMARGRRSEPATSPTMVRRTDNSNAQKTPE